MVKNPPTNTGDVGSISGLGRSPGGRNGIPLQYSCLESPMDRGAWQAIVHRVTKELDMTEHAPMHAYTKLPPSDFKTLTLSTWRVTTQEWTSLNILLTALIYLQKLHKKLSNTILKSKFTMFMVLPWPTNPTLLSEKRKGPVQQDSGLMNLSELCVIILYVISAQKACV